MWWLILPPVFSAADRLTGAAKPSFAGKRAAVLASVVAAATLAGGWPMAVVAFCWWVYRGLPFWGGSGSPKTSAERRAAALRHLVITPALPIMAALTGGPVVLAVVLMAIYWAVRWELAVWNGDSEQRAIDLGRPVGNQNALVEILGGLIYGAALSAYLAVAGPYR